MTAVKTDAPAPMVLAVGPSLIIGNRQQFKARLLDALNSGQRQFVIDFTNAEYIDASGLGVLVTVNKHVVGVNGKIVLAGLNDDVREQFEMTQLDTLFTIVDTVGRALQLLGETA